VIFAIALLAAACGTIIGGFNACMQANRYLWLESKAADLAVTLLSEMQMAGGSAVDEGPTDYLKPLEDWCWQVATVDLDPQTEAGATMTQVQITITYKPEGYSYTLYYLTPSSGEAAAASGSSLASGEGLAGGGP
jgi:hypothetical protein